MIKNTNPDSSVKRFNHSVVSNTIAMSIYVEQGIDIIYSFLLSKVTANLKKVLFTFVLSTSLCKGVINGRYSVHFKCLIQTGINF